MSTRPTVPVGRRRVPVWVKLAAAVLVVGLLANFPVTTKQGVNFEVSSRRMPLYRKAFEFLDRDAQYRQLANEITRESRSDQARVQAVFDWTARRIQPAPEGWPVIDDHILNIIIRGYGVSDQRADVFATLATYAGVPSFWRKVRVPGMDAGIILTFSRVDGRWVVMDVAGGFMFRNVSGDLASAEDLAAGRIVVPAAAGSVMIGSTPYGEALRQLRMPPVPRPLRAELQMFWPRLWDQMTHAVGRGRDGGDDGSER